MKIKGKDIAEKTLDFFLTSRQIEVIFPSSETWMRIISIFKDNSLSLIDAQIIACMEELGEKEIYSFDRHFDAIKSIKRIS